MRRKRLQFDFSSPAVAHLDELVKQSGAASRAEVVRQALKFYDLLLNAQSKGSRIIRKDPDGREVEWVIV